MQKQSSSLDDSSLNVAFFSVLIISLFSFFLFTEGETIQKEGSEKPAMLSSMETEIEEEMREKGSDEHLTFFKKDTLNTSSAAFHEKPQVLGAKDTKNEPIKKEDARVKDTLTVELTGYSSTPDQTNCQPFITASGARVKKGVVAANFLEFGTRIRIPEYFGEKEFIVKDRMNTRFSPPYNNVSHEGYVDIWFESRWEANNFGRVISQIEIVE